MKPTAPCWVYIDKANGQTIAKLWAVPAAVLATLRAARYLCLFREGAPFDDGTIWYAVITITREGS